MMMMMMRRRRRRRRRSNVSFQRINWLNRAN